MKKLITALAAALAASGSAHAAYIWLNDGSQNGNTAHTYTNGPVTLTVTAGIYDSGGNITESPGGLGPLAHYSYGTGFYEGGGDAFQVDGAGNDEVLLLRFNTDVHITGAWFSYVNDGDNFDVFVDSDSDDVLELSYDDQSIAGGSFYRSVNLLALNLFGDFFGFGASGYHDNWKLKKIIYEEIPDVPLPAAAPLFIAGLAGFGFARGRKKRAQA